MSKTDKTDLTQFNGYTGSLPDEYQSLALIDSPVARGLRTYTSHDITEFVLKAENQAYQYGRITEIKKHRTERAENTALRAENDKIKAEVERLRVDYMNRSNLGNPEAQHRIIKASAALNKE